MLDNHQLEKVFAITQFSAGYAKSSHFDTKLEDCILYIVLKMPSRNEDLAL